VAWRRGTLGQLETGKQQQGRHHDDAGLVPSTRPKLLALSLLAFGVTAAEQRTILESVGKGTVRAGFTIRGGIAVYPKSTYRCMELRQGTRDLR
jgi:hypothetical protein